MIIFTQAFFHRCLDVIVSSLFNPLLPIVRLGIGIGAGLWWRSLMKRLFTVFEHLVFWSALYRRRRVATENQSPLNRVFVRSNRFVWTVLFIGNNHLAFSLPVSVARNSFFDAWTTSWGFCHERRWPFTDWNALLWNDLCAFSLGIFCKRLRQL